jgi:hypothetical protein
MAIPPPRLKPKFPEENPAAGAADESRGVS